MSKVIKGVVKYAGDEKKFGKYGATLRGDEWDNVWFNSEKRYDGIIERGNTVKLKVQKTGKSYKVLGAKLIAEAEDDDSPAPARGGSDRSAAIQYQHSQEMGIQATALLLANDAFMLPNKRDDKRVVIEELIDELTAKFYNDIGELRALETAAEIEEDLEDTADTDEDDDDVWDDDD